MSFLTQSAIACSSTLTTTLFIPGSSPLLEVEKPIVFFDTIFRKYELMQILHESKGIVSKNTPTRPHTIFLALRTKKYDALLGCLYGYLSFNFQTAENIS